LSYLLDTNVVSEIRKTTGDSNVLRWYSDVPADDLKLSVLVVGEVAQGIERLRRRGDGIQADTLGAWLTALKNDFRERLVAVSTPIAERWGRLNAVSPLPIIDGLMAATALELDLTFVTRDTAALAATGVRLLDPWSG
jgi:predicted nucleic acid-binding protein